MLTPGLLLLAAAGPALAVPPTGWEEAPSVSPLSFLLIILLIPAGLFAVIALLASLASGGGEGAYRPGLPWGHEPEWFGGPRDGLESATDEQPRELAGSERRGGTSGSW